MMRVKLDDGAVVPTKGTQNSAGYDVCSIESILIPPGTHSKIHTGVYLEIPHGSCGILSHRSGMNSKQGAQVYGVIDSDYRGEVMITMFNSDPNHEIRVSPGDRVAQLRIVEVQTHTFEVVDELTVTKRGEGGHGSTGR